MTFLEELREQRWDDHRFYHQSRINQSLHFVSAISFLCAYVMLFFHPATAALVGWLVGMVTRQSGHFFFEPKGYDEVNHVTHEHKEEIKVGYNLQRKIVLHAVWLALPLVLWFEPTAFGIFPDARAGLGTFMHHLGQVWLVLALGAMAFRVAQLTVTRSLQTGIVWVTKIITDPFHDIKLYYRAPLHLLRGELLDTHQSAHGA